MAFSAALLYSQAQSSSADLKGTVQDPSGASIAGATLSVKDPQTGLARNAVSDSNGGFLFTSLPPSRYSLRVEAATIPQLERSVQALLKELTRRSRSPASR